MVLYRFPWFYMACNNVCVTPSGAQDSATKHLERKFSERHKKKIPWYNILYPSYKSKNDDFKRIFKELPPEERLIVDYSCALQHDMLIHGRLYASPNFLCFYANIFVWETRVTLDWKDVTSITKEKTALVIPNAILIQTKSDKHFLTSFATRGKTYLMLFRIWQHALMNQPMSAQEMWYWVHVCYGEELGLTSDDEDYVSPYLLESQVADKQMTSTEESSAANNLRKEVDVKEREPPLDIPLSTATSDHLLSPADSSDMSESEEDKNLSSTESRPPVVPSTCPIKHEGRMLLRETYPLCIDDLFTLLFTYNKFNMNLLESMKYTDINFQNWEDDPATGLKTRKSRLTVPVTQPIGPKTCHVKETQVLQGCSKPGELYVIEVEAFNFGVPYCESFYIATHFCLTCVSNSESVFTVHCQIKYRKSVWGIVKNFIEKNVWSGLEDYFKALSKALDEECSTKKTENGTGVSRIQKRESTKVITSLPQPEVLPEETRAIPTEPSLYNINDIALWAILGVLAVLVLFNIILFYKLSSLQSFDKEYGFSTTIDSRLLNEERSHEEWLLLLRKQTAQHHKEIKIWKNTLQSIVALLKQAEDSIANLQTTILSSEGNRVDNSMLEPDNIALPKTHNEL